MGTIIRVATIVFCVVLMYVWGDILADAIYKGYTGDMLWSIAWLLLLAVLVVIMIKV